MIPTSEDINQKKKVLERQEALKRKLKE